MFALRTAAAAVLLVSALACGGGGTPTDGGNDLMLMTVDVLPKALSVQQGASGSVKATVQRTGNTSTVSVSVDGLPAGVTVTTTPLDAQASSTIAVTVASSVAPGPYTATVHASAGTLTAQATYVLTVTAAPDFTVTTSASALSITAGLTGTSTIGTTRTGGFSSDVVLTLSSTQTGITGAFTPPTISSGTSALVVSVAPSVAAGTYTATVAGTSGAVIRTVPITISVAALPNVVVALDPVSLAIAYGAQSTTTVDLTRTNFTGAVNLAASGQLTGISVTFNTSPTTANSSVATVVVDPSTPVGNYPVTITASGVGIGSSAATLNVGVQVPNTEFRYCTAFTTELPVWFAYQDGTGGWTRVTPATSGALTVYRFQISSAIGAVAVVAPAQQVSLRAGSLASAAYSGLKSNTALTPVRTGSIASLQFAPANAGGGSTTLLSYGTREELIALGAQGTCGTSATTGRNFTSSISNASANQSVLVELGGSYAQRTGNAAFSLFNVAIGSQSLFAGAKNSGSDVISRYYFVRDITAAGGALASVDLTGPNSFAPASSTLSVQNALGDMYNVYTNFYVQPGAFSIESNSVSSNLTTALPFSSVPAAQRIGGEFDDMNVSTDNTVGYNGENRFVNVMESGPLQPMVAVLGAKLGTTTLTFATQTPYPRPRLQSTIPADYGANVEIRLNQVNDFSFTGNDVRFVLGKGYRTAMATGTTVDITMPDLSAVPGFPLTSLIPRGSRVLMATTAENIAGGFGINPVFVSGARYISAGRRQDITY